MHVLKKDLQKALADVKGLVQGEACSNFEEACKLLLRVQDVVERFPALDHEVQRDFEKLQLKNIEARCERDSAMDELNACRRALRNHERFLVSLCDFMDIGAHSSVCTRVYDGSLLDITSMLRNYNPDMLQECNALQPAE